eukprot:2350301-Pyramimonas_sp.AAC.1
MSASSVRMQVSWGELAGSMFVKCFIKWCWKSGSLGRSIWGVRLRRGRRFHRRGRNAGPSSASRRCTAWWSEPRSGQVVANASNTRCRAFRSTSI